MEKKYLFFDIDGTLTNRATGGIVPSAKEALQRLEENGPLTVFTPAVSILQQRAQLAQCSCLPSAGLVAATAPAEVAIAEAEC